MYIHIYTHTYIYIFPLHIYLLSFFLSLSSLSLSLSLSLSIQMWGMCHVCVVWGKTHRLDREKHTHTRTGYILKYSQNISKIISEE